MVIFQSCLFTADEKANHQPEPATLRMRKTQRSPRSKMVFTSIGLTKGPGGGRRGRVRAEGPAPPSRKQWARLLLQTPGLGSCHAWLYWGAEILWNKGPGSQRRRPLSLPRAGGSLSTQLPQATSRGSHLPTWRQDRNTGPEGTTGSSPGCHRQPLQPSPSETDEAPPKAS